MSFGMIVTVLLRKGTLFSEALRVKVYGRLAVRPYGICNPLACTII